MFYLKEIHLFPVVDRNLWKYEWFQGYDRNRAIIDLQYTPVEIKDEVLKQFNNQNKDRGKLFNYFVKKKLNNLVENISEF